jgi:putative CocE/NonD family hydrolase
LFDLIDQTWRSFDAWPQPRRRHFYTSSDGLAATTMSGRLLPQEPDHASRDAIVHDPWRPVPSLGGHNAEHGGMQDRTDLDDRADVLVYTTAPLAAATRFVGDVELLLSVRADQPCFDISAILSRVTPDGRAFNLTQGHRRVEHHGETRVGVPMRALCATLPAGDSLRLSLAATNFPAFAVNPGTGIGPAEARLIDNRVITLLVESGGLAPTCIELPIIG